MAEKVKKLSLQRDYKNFLYFIDGNGNVCQKSKSGKGDSEVLVENVLTATGGGRPFFLDSSQKSREPLPTLRG